MLDLLVKLMLIAGLAQFGMSWRDLGDCRSRQCFKQMEETTRRVSRIGWRPIGVFPREGRHFR